MCIAVAYTDIVNQLQVIKIGRTVWQVVKSMSIIRCRMCYSMFPAYVISSANCAVVIGGRAMFVDNAWAKACAICWTLPTGCSERGELH